MSQSTSACFGSKKIWQKFHLIGKVVALLAILLLLGIGFSQLTTYHWAASGCGDLYSFWNAARNFRDGVNPYIARINDPTQSACRSVLAVYNPPLIFTLLYPLSLIRYTYVQIGWVFLTVGAFAFVLSNLVARIASKKQKIWMIVCGISFFPIWLHLLLGQLSIIIFLTLDALFLALFRRQSLLSGVACGALIWKPQLCYLLVFAILIQKIRRIDFRFLIGLLFSVLTFASLPLLIRPSIYSDFLYADRLDPFLLLTPTLGSWLQTTFAPGSLFLHMVPTVCSTTGVILWAVVRKKTDLSQEQFGFLVALSVFTAPYIWTYDFIVLLFPISLFWYRQRRHPLVSATLCIAVSLLWFQTGTMDCHIWFSALILVLSGELLRDSLTKYADITTENK